ncbi:MAG: hypothetical protein AB7T27_12735 [Kiritimatiellia bacterium]
MWKYPRMAAWFILGTVFLLLARLPFFAAPMIPNYIEFNPGIALVPLMGVFWGPAAVWSALLATLLGDWITGLWSSLSVWKALGIASMAFTAQYLWDTGAPNAYAGRKHTRSWSSTFHYLHAASAGCFVAAAWTGLGADMARLYPFPYISALILAHHLIFVNLLGIAFYRFSVREVIPDWGNWRSAMENEYPIPVPAHFASVSVWVTGTGACVAGWLIGAVFYRITPLRPYVLGNYCGTGLAAVLIIFLAAHSFLLLRGPLRKVPAKRR